ncbi:Beta-1,4-galactosyltransferase 5 [Holothuria leucospilota]|uniref:Beta-1,4-galactosyltransferase n=1 Tax=Holothuria leucospilota TaxID=206669 RepID=A0A9Q1H359_HOLLE|nr:Beta-1,4-galactosyltransferase 5 [Holothuria leucospilota]
MFLYFTHELTSRRLRHLLGIGVVTVLFFITNLFANENALTPAWFVRGKILNAKYYSTRRNWKCEELTQTDGEHAPNLTFISTEEVERKIIGENIQEVTSSLSVINSEGFDIFNMTSLRQTFNRSAINFSDDFAYLPGGHWKPRKFNDSSKVALLVPFRNREQVLGVFLRHMVPFLLRQRLEFTIFIIEQANNLKFNRGMLANVGFKESLRFEDWDCIILHDIDFLPRYNNNSYTCKNMPRHLMSGIEKRPKLLPSEFNGVTGFSREQFVMMNGAPNRYWGWGGEDHDLRTRAEVKGFNISRTQWPYGYYDHIPHASHKDSDTEPKRREYVKQAEIYLSQDGLSNLNYPKPEVYFHPLYVHIMVNISKLPRPKPRRNSR